MKSENFQCIISKPSFQVHTSTTGFLCLKLLFLLLLVRSFVVTCIFGTCFPWPTKGFGLSCCVANTKTIHIFETLEHLHNVLSWSQVASAGTSWEAPKLHLAWTMCARATQQLRSISHVCTCKERHHPPPPNPPPKIAVLPWGRSRRRRLKLTAKAPEKWVFFETIISFWRGYYWWLRNPAITTWDGA